MRFETGYEKEGARIEMTPLMDVVFLLLVFFIYAVARMTTVSAVSVSLPEAEADEKPGRHATITLCSDGTTWLDDVAVPREELVGRIAAGNDAKAPILIRADREVPLGRGLSLLSDLQKAGLTSVAFETSEPAASDPAVTAGAKDSSGTGSW